MMDINQILGVIILCGTLTFILGFFVGAKVLLNHINEELKKEDSEIEVKWYLNL